MIALVILSMCGGIVNAQPSPRFGATQSRGGGAVPDEAGAIGRGWGLFAEGRFTDAAAIAEQTLGLNPGSLPALDLAVESEGARAGGAASLAAYERWIGSKPDAPHVLRDVAGTVLREIASARNDRASRVVALGGLARDGDAAAVAALRAGIGSGTTAEARALAAAGDGAGIAALVGVLKSPVAGVGDKVDAIAALRDGASQAAIPPLIALLIDARAELRAAAAEALGRMGARDAMAMLRRLVADGRELDAVRFAAAGALVRLGDESGGDLMSEQLASPVPAVRLAALGVQPVRDTAWQQEVRDIMLRANEPITRLEAARLLAPYDPAAARATAEDLARSSDAGAREGAAVLAIRLVTDFASLRQGMHAADSSLRALAAARVLELVK